MTGTNPYQDAYNHLEQLSVSEISEFTRLRLEGRGHEPQYDMGKNQDMPEDFLAWAGEKAVQEKKPVIWAGIVEGTLKNAENLLVGKVPANIYQVLNPILDVADNTVRGDIRSYMSPFFVPYDPGKLQTLNQQGYRTHLIGPFANSVTPEAQSDIELVKFWEVLSRNAIDTPHSHKAILYLGKIDDNKWWEALQKYVGCQFRNITEAIRVYGNHPAEFINEKLKIDKPAWERVPQDYFDALYHNAVGNIEKRVGVFLKMDQIKERVHFLRGLKFSLELDKFELSLLEKSLPSR